MTEIIAFGSSWQSHYSSGLGEKWTRGFSEHRESFLGVQKESTDWPPTVINTWGSSGIIRMAACVGTPRHPQSQLPWESNPWGLHLRGQSLLQCGPLQTGHGARGSLDPDWDTPPFHSDNKSFPFHLGPSGHFSSGCFRADLTAVAGASVFGLVLFSSSYSLPSFWVLVLKDLVGLHKTVQLQFLQHYWLGHRLG